MTAEGRAHYNQKPEVQGQVGKAVFTSTPVP